MQKEIWVKLFGNAPFNPVSALTRATPIEMVRDSGVSVLIRRIMQEVELDSRKMGMEIDQRMAGAEKIGAHKTPMLQDLEAGRPMKLGALVGAVVELGERLNLARQHTGTVYSSVKLLAQPSAPFDRPEVAILDSAARRESEGLVPAPKTVLFGA